MKIYGTIYEDDGYKVLCNLSIDPKYLDDSDRIVYTDLSDCKVISTLMDDEDWYPYNGKFVTYEHPDDNEIEVTSIYRNGELISQIKSE